MIKLQDISDQVQGVGAYRAAELASTSSVGLGSATSMYQTSLAIIASLCAVVTKGSPLGDTLSLSCEASVGTSGSNN